MGVVGSEDPSEVVVSGQNGVKGASRAQPESQLAGLVAHFLGVPLQLIKLNWS